MNYNSPQYSQKANPHARLSDEFKPPYTSPPNNNGQGFSPFSYSSPKKSNKGRMRYFNISSSSPYNHHRNNQKHNRKSFDSEPPISAYYDHTMLLNPWTELEKAWEEKKALESNSHNPEHSDASSK